MSTLNTKDTEILKAIAEWTKKKGFNKAYDMLLEETGLSSSDVPSKNVLDTKWSTILVLNKKIHDLESQIKNLKEEIDSAKTNGTTYNKSDGDSTMV